MQFILIILIGLSSSLAGGDKYEANIVFFARKNVSSGFTKERSGPAVDIAMDKVKALYNDTVNFNFMYVDFHECTPVYIGVYASRLVYSTNVSVFIGPACNEALEPLSYMALTWNIPIVTPLGNSGIFVDDLFSVVTRLSAWTLIHFATFTRAIFTHYGWTYFSLIHDTGGGFATTLGSTLSSMFQSSEYSSLYFWANIPIQPTDMSDNEVVDILQRASRNSRVIILLARPPELRRFMLIAWKLGYTNGDYIFISGAASSGVRESWIKADDGYDEIVKDIYKCVFVITVLFDVSSSYPSFKEELINRALSDYGYDFKNSEPSILLTGYHDAIMIYAQVLNETLALGEDPKDGKKLSARMWNRTYQGIAGNFTLAPTGFRNGNLGLQQVNNDGVFRVVATYDQAGDKYVSNPDEEILWKNGQGPPVNVPKCGFTNNNCIPGASKNVIYGVGISFGVLLLAALVVLPLLHRRWKKQMELDQWWWKIDKKDLTFHDTAYRSTLSLMSHTSLLKTNNGTDTWAVAFCKGNPVRVRTIKLVNNNVLVTGKLVQEFKKVRDINCSRLNRVIGACLETVPGALLVTEHCAKGSLQDLLGNQSFSLDAQFKFSLAIDVAEGMCFLTQSSIGYHGNLSSSVCLIDNRFSVKITDYGLPSLFSNEKKDCDSQECKTECLWKAPEVLRSVTPKGSKEADVYSYGIILCEILSREQPFFEETGELGTSAVLEKLKAGGSPLFRPKLDLPLKMKELAKLMSECWQENPSSRPDFPRVKQVLRSQASRFGESVNLLDNLLRRMESYANNLEKMVEDKTKELVEEKKRSEQLLYEILPKSVAENLKLGLPVEPEAFESVTIYFSDIVGFTNISARSTPLQVVDLLNDLYSCFDAIIDTVNVYKVETIGDAYMVVSGLPDRNGDHAQQIATLALLLRQAIGSFIIKHLPAEKVQLRIGIHTGPTVAGVVGLKMPRYCLFGDTVNTASRMESCGEAMKIHISSETYIRLEKYIQFTLIPRGEINVKGKGTMATYWLEGEN